MPTFKRGATLVEFFELPKTVDDGAYKSHADPAFPDPLAALDLLDFDELRRIGFDHMRVPLDVGPLMQADAETQQAILDQLVAVVTAINRHGPNVLMTLFPPSLHRELPQTCRTYL
jgi:endoglucanase